MRGPTARRPCGSAPDTGCLGRRCWSSRPSRPATRARLDALEREIESAGRPTVTDAAWVGRALVALGNPDRALDLLERVRPRGARLWFYLRSAEFDAVRSNPRFRRLVEESKPE